MKGGCEAWAWSNSGGAVSVWSCLGFGIFFIFLCGPIKGLRRRRRGKNQKKGKKEGKAEEEENSDWKSDHLQRLTYKLTHLYYK